MRHGLGELLAVPISVCRYVIIWTGYLIGTSFHEDDGYEAKLGVLSLTQADFI